MQRRITIHSIRTKLQKVSILALTLLFAVLVQTSCGSTTRTSVKTNAEQNQVTISVTTNNPTNWDVSPDVNLKKDVNEKDAKKD